RRVFLVPEPRTLRVLSAISAPPRFSGSHVVSGASRLSSLLVRDGIVGVKRMEQAFQRQVIYGGALDTILLEMAAISEERLTQYLSLATGLPAADRDLVEYFDPRAVQICPRKTAEDFHVAPVALEGQALRV